MRVAFASPTTVHHADSAAARRLDRLARAVEGRGHDVTYFTAKWWEGDFRNFDHHGLTYRSVGNGSGETVLTPFRVARAITEVNPEVVHAFCHSPVWTAGARLAANLTGAGFLVDWFDPPSSEGALSGWFRRRGLRGADRVITPSETVETTVREFGIDGQSVRVIPTGIDLERIEAIEPIPSGDIVYSRRLDDGANLETLLLALAEFREYDWMATIIGDGPRRQAYERQARDLRIEDRVEFLGDRPVDERIARFKDAHVYVHTAEYTPFAHDLLRALAAGCVSIVEYHQQSSAHELVVHEDRGFTATSPEELTRRLAAAGDLERRTFDESFADFADETFLERYLELYRAVRE